MIYQFFTEIILIIAIVLYAITPVFCIIALIGVIKENKYIAIAMTVFSAIEDFAHFANGDIGSAIFSLLFTISIGIYVYMIFLKQKKNSSV